MYYEFEGCEHLLTDLFDYALQKQIPVVVVDNEIQQQYLQHEKLYNSIAPLELFQHVAQHELDVHVLDHVQLRLDDIAAGKR